MDDYVPSAFMIGDITAALAFGVMIAALLLLTRGRG